MLNDKHIKIDHLRILVKMFGFQKFLFLCGLFQVKRSLDYFLIPHHSEGTSYHYLLMEEDEKRLRSLTLVIKMYYF